MADTQTRTPPTNRLVIDRLHEIADLLALQGANPFRVGAYRRAADTVGGLDVDVAELVARDGIQGLMDLPAIGSGIARTIYEIVTTGRSSQLDRLRGSADPVALFQSVPGIGPELARRIHETLHIDSLEALELAAHDGRLEQVPGVGPRRAAAIRGALTTLLGRRVPRRSDATGLEPPVAMILDVDREYRDKAQGGRLPTIAPHRFNPEGKDWLPVLHTRRDGWQFTALYSNTAQAHRLGRTHDWVVVYFYDDHHQEGQRTVVTETRGPLAGRRVVRGRERECRAYYAGHPSASSTAESR